MPAPTGPKEVAVKISSFQLDYADVETVTTYVSHSTKKSYICLHWISETPVGAVVEHGRFTFMELIFRVGPFFREWILIEEGK